jgi:acyl transferase domain-containing protein
MPTDRPDTESLTPPCDLAIVGIGCLFPKAPGTGWFWANVKRGIDCLSDVPATHWDPADYFDADPKSPDKTYAKRGGFLDAVDFNPMEFGIAPRDLEATDTTQLLGLVAAKKALQDAGVVLTGGGRESPDDLQTRGTHAPRPPKSVDRSRVSVILGVTGTLELVIPLGARLGHPKWKRAMREAGIPEDAIADASARIAESYVPWQENSFPGLLGNVVAGRIANRLDLHGTNCVVDAACASSLSAIHLAGLELAAGRSDVVVTGGADTFNDIFMFMCFSKTPALSATGSSKPFDANGDGTILGEGIGTVVLKRRADAVRDGDTIYAVIKSVGTSSDGKGNAIYAPSADGQVRCLTNAYALAGITPDTIELVEAHGTGTKVGDGVEATALTQVYGKARGARVGPWCALGSVKSQIGHTKAAAGVAGLIKAALALHNKVLPPTIKVTWPVEPLRAADSPFYVNTEARPWLAKPEHPRRAGLSAFGFGGSNFHAVLEEHAPEKVAPDWDGSVEILAVTGETPAAVARSVRDIPTAWDGFARAAESSRTQFDATAPSRLLLVAHRELTDLPKLIASAASQLAAQPGAAEWFTPDGAYYGHGAAAGGLGVLFPGQGSQAVGMLRDLTTTFPELLSSLSAANDGDPTDGPRLVDVIYPPRDFAADAPARQNAALTRTDRAQPALGALELGLWDLLANRFGVTADATAGHSFGELPALAAAGRITPADAQSLAHLRGLFMAGAGRGEAGGMTAVLTDCATVESAVAAAGADVVVANRNGPRQTVVSGAKDELAKLESSLSSRGVRFVRLPVSAAFHSRFVADAAAPFRDALDGIAIHAGAIPAYANAKAAPYPADATAAKDLLGHQLARPVLFDALVRAMAGAGVRTFLEVGPGAKLARMAAEILATDPDTAATVACVAVDSSGGSKPGLLDLAQALARLAARGHAVRLTAWESESRCRPSPPAKPGLTVPVCGANYVSPRSPRPPRPAPSLPASAETTAMPDPARPTTPADATALSAALETTQRTLAALQQMQEQTAALHRQFLESQQQAQRTIAALVSQQQVALGMPGGPPPIPVSAPAPAPAPAAASVLVASPVPAPAPAVIRPAGPVTPPAPPPAVVMPAVSVTPPAPPPAVTRLPATNGTPHAPPAADRVLLEVVSEKTGYPVSTLDLSMSLDGDLGVDSIKRVEILSALQDRLPDAPVVKPEQLGTLQTLGDVASFLAGGVAIAAPLTVAAAELKSAVTVPASTAALAGLVAEARAEVADIAGVLLDVVSQKTGYPVSTLDLGMSMDNDLGIDSIKRVEILSAIQDRLPDAPVVTPDHLGTLRSLKDVADYLRGTPNPATAKIAIDPRDLATMTESFFEELPPSSSAGMTSVSPSELLAPPTETISKIRHATPSESVLMASTGSGVTKTPPARAEAVADPNKPATHFPPEDPIERSILQTIDLDASAARPRVVLPAGRDVLIVGDDGPFARELVRQVRAMGLTAVSQPWSAATSARLPDNLSGLILAAPAKAGAEPALNRLAFQWVQRAGAKVRTASPALLATVSQLDGAFGIAAMGPAADPAAGGLAGIAKTVRAERPEVAAKAIDVAPAFAEADPAAAAAAVIDEAFTRGPAEVGVSAKLRCTLDLARTVRRPVVGPLPLGPQDVVLVTGGARGVTAEAAVALASATKATLILTGRTAPPPPADPDWAVGLTDDAALKAAAAAHLGAGATPKLVADLAAKAQSHREIRETLARVTAAGAKVAYYPVNVSNGRAVADLLHQVRVKFGPVTVLIHGAGVLADKRIEQLPVEQFDAVYATKAEGAKNLLDLMRGEDLKAIVFFGSTTGRLGRVGQIAYACANEVLNKLAQAEAKRRPSARVVCLNWGPWEGGMVTPGLRKLFESEGVGLIPLAAGGQFVVRELAATGRSVEVVAMGVHRGATAAPRPAELSPRVSPPLGPTATTGTQAPPPTAAPAPELAVAFERAVSVDSHPVLRSHVLDGRAVLPMALHLEWLAHAALHGNPGLVFLGVDNLRITSGVQIEATSAVTIKALAGRAVKHDKVFVVPVELRGRRKDGREIIHSRADILLTASLPKPPAPEAPPPVQPYPHPVDEVYKYFLFHGPDLHGIERVDGLTEVAFIGTAYPAPAPTEWFAGPLRSNWVADPLVLDTSFQMLILWSFAQHGAGSLPCFAGRYRQYRRSFPPGPVKVVARVTRDNGTFARADIEYLDADGTVIAQMQDYECVIDAQLNMAFRRNQLAPALARV